MQAIGRFAIGPTAGGNCLEESVRPEIERERLGCAAPLIRDPEGIDGLVLSSAAGGEPVVDCL